VGSIAKSHDDQNVKRSKVLLLHPMHNQKWEVGWTLSLQQHGPKCNVHELCCLLQQIFISLTLPQNINVIKNDGEEANSHYPPLMPPTSNIPSSNYSQQPKLHLEKETLEELFFNSWIANANPTITCVNSSSSLL